jgi:hypothetical protein
MVRQVTVVAILMIVQGGLEILMGIFMTVMGPVMFTMFSQMPQQPGVQGPPPELGGIIGGVYIVLGVAALIAGVLRIIAGIRNLKYRGRGLGLVALFAGVLTLPGYCCLTSIGLLIYGLIVYFNADVARAFEMGEQGRSADEIKAAFDRPMGPGPGAPYGSA